MMMEWVAHYSLNLTERGDRRMLARDKTGRQGDEIEEE